MKYLDAAPAYLGGKRKVAREILEAISRYDIEPGATIADAFAGGCMVGLAAKLLGYRVIGNDVGPIAIATGKALIENRSRTLSREAVVMALEHEPITDLPDEKELAAPEVCRAALAKMAGACRDATGDDKWLLQAWTARTALSLSSYGIPRMKPTRRPGDRPVSVAVRAAKMLNAGVFDNGLDNEMRAGDAVEFLGEVEADVAYLDPPYPGTLAYEQVYAGINHLLDPALPTTPSPWSAEDGWKLLREAFAAAENIPLVVISMGKGADPDEIGEMMTEAGREPTWRSLDHKHLAVLKRENDPEGDELLLVGKKR